MKKSEINGLLRVAANPNCSNRLRNQIHSTLVDAITESGPNRVHRTEVHKNEIKTIFDALFATVVVNAPALLPTLFPVIYHMLHGESDDENVAKK